MQYFLLIKFRAGTWIHLQHTLVLARRSLLVHPYGGSLSITNKTGEKRMVRESNLTITRGLKSTRL